MFTFGVSEPVYYYRTSFSYRLNKIPWNSDAGRAQQALLLALHHWCAPSRTPLRSPLAHGRNRVRCRGILGYVPYVVTTLAIGLPAYRWGLPLTLRTSFYPIIGNLVHGIVGDLIDAIGIATTTFGVCTSLGLGAQTIAAGAWPTTAT